MAPSSYISAADPRVFGPSETVVQDAATGRTYTPQDYRRLFRDARLPGAQDIADYYIGLLHMADRSSFPFVDVYGVDHFSLPSKPQVLARLIADAARPRSRCS
jgi:lecithin-cholesterol acyltransferase